MPPHVKTAFEGPNGIYKGISKGKIWIDHSTTDLEQTREMETKVREEKGAALIEAPISGGMEALKKGQMTVYVATDDKQNYTNVRPLLEASFQRIIYTGPLGTALIPKVLSNMVSCSW